jgi:hypothetical protein
MVAGDQLAGGQEGRERARGAEDGRDDVEDAGDAEQPAGVERDLLAPLRREPGEGRGVDREAERAAVDTRTQSERGSAARSNAPGRRQSSRRRITGRVASRRTWLTVVSPAGSVSSSALPGNTNVTWQ